MRNASLAAAALALSMAGVSPAWGQGAEAFAAELAERSARWARERTRPEAALAVVGVVDGLWDRARSADVAAFVSEAAADGRAHPLARAHARLAAWDAALRRGEAGAERHAAGLGVLRTWQVLGPFPAGGGGAIDRAFSPERGLGDLAEPVPAGRRVLSWRPVPEETLHLGAVPVGSLVAAEEGVAYLLTYIRCERARDAALRVGTTGPVRVWLNGAPVLEGRVRERPLGLDQDQAAVRLGAGWNVLLVKLEGAGGWRARARLTDLRGEALEGIAFAARLPEDAALASAEAAPRRPVDTLESALVRRTRRGSRGARQAAWRDLALFHAWVSPRGPDAEPVMAALAGAGLDDARAPADTLLLAARHAEEPDVRRRAAARLVDRTDATPRARAEAAHRLALHYQVDQGMPAPALAWLFRARELDAGYWPAELELLMRLDALALSEASFRRLEALSKRSGGPGELRRYQAQREHRRGRLEAADGLVDGLLENRRTDVGLWTLKAEIARDRGDTDGALLALRHRVAARPDLTGGRVELAAALQAAGRRAAALRALEEGLAVAPDDVRLLQRSGRLLLEEGDRPAALSRLSRALALRPQDPELRRLVERLAPGSDEQDLVKRFARDVVKLARTHGAFERGRYPRVVLSHVRAVRVHPNGLSDEMVQRVVRIDTEAGAEAEQTFEIVHAPSREMVEVRAARIYRPGGEVVEAASRSFRDLSEPWYGLYYDLRAEVVRFPKLAPGDIVEVTYVISHVGDGELLPGYFGDIHLFAEDVPRAESEYVVLAPPGMKLHARAPASGVVASTRRDGEGTRHTYRMTKVSRVPIEDGMPGATEIAPYVHVSSYESWERLARAYWALIEEQLVSDDDVARLARRVTAGATDTAAKVTAVHNAVVTLTRYVGLELGIHSYKPYRVPLVLERKFGDCKDKASLLVVMLREVGVEAHLVLLRTRRNGAVDAEPASLAVFDHAVAYVPELDWWLDGTAEHSGSRELPPEDQGVLALIIDGAGGRRVTTPVLDASKNVTERTLRLSLARGGAARVEETVRVTGADAAAWRRAYQAAEERVERYEKVWNGMFAGARLEAVDMPGLGDLESPVRVVARGTAPDVGRVAGKSRVFPLLGRNSELARNYARASVRRQDLLLASPFVDRETVTYVLPAGARVEGLPDDRELSSPFGTFSVEVRAQGREITVRHELSITTRRIAKADYAAWRSFLLGVDAALNRPLEVAW